MSIQGSTTLRNAWLDQIATTLGASEVVKFFTGSVPANCAAADSGTKVAEFDLAASNDWVAASGGTKALNSLPLTVTGAAAGVAGYFRFYQSDGTTCHLQGTITLTGAGGDMTLDNTNITVGQTVKITGFTLTAPGA
jgi:hypothetical protein